MQPITNLGVGAVSPSLDRPRIGKSIPIALAFALRACVHATLRERDDSAVARGGPMQVVGGVPPVPVLAGPGQLACFRCG